MLPSPVSPGASALSAAPTPSTPTLRCCPLTDGHLSEVLALDRLCFGGLWSEAGYRRELESPNSDLWVVIGQGQIPSPLGEELPESPEPETGWVLGFGCHWAILDEGHITLLAIAPPYQRQGMGQWLLLKLLQAARQRGLARATLEVRASNEIALNLYEKLGFKQVGRRKGYYPDGEDALILWQSGLQQSQWQSQWRQWLHQSQQRLQQQGWYLPD